MSIPSTGLSDEAKRSKRRPKEAAAKRRTRADGRWKDADRGRTEIALVVSPKRACTMLDMSPPTLYELINSGELESYKDGASRKITVRSIKKRIADKIAATAGFARQPAA